MCHMKTLTYKNEGVLKKVIRYFKVFYGRDAKKFFVIGQYAHSC